MSDARPNADPGTLIHQVNNLLGVIYTQVEIARTSKDPQMVEAALRFILDSARQTEQVVKECRRGESQTGPDRTS